MAVDSRAVAPSALVQPDRWLLQTLVDAELLTPPQAEDLSTANDASIWEAAVARHYATDEIVTRLLSGLFKVPIADLRNVDARVSGLLPEALARKHAILPIWADERTIRIATADPRDLNLEQTLAFVTGRSVILQVAPPKALHEKIDEIYRPEASINRLLSGLGPANVETVDEMIAVPAAKDPALEAPMTRLVEAMISDAVREGASDIHAEPLEGGTSVRYRIDGVLKEVMRLPGTAGPALVRRIKILAKLDVTDPLHPHDGRAAIRVDGKAVDLRVSTVPIARRGEKVVVRILDKANLRANIPDLMLPPGEEELMQRLLGHREGIVLVTGPTGSGKTTTLYAMLNQLKTGKTNIVTVEDPVEYDIPGISQLQVSEAQGFTFATALRSVLRQDPDVVLIGEIRDQETAGIAVQAGLSGHLVLSTLHTNDAPSAVVRIRDLGVEAFKVASVLRGVVAQRLVRRLCTVCAESINPDDLPNELRPVSSRIDATPKRAVGCKSCGGSGYRGRIAVLEVLPVDETIAHLIEGGALPDQLYAAARPLGMKTLWQSGLERVWQGLTSVEEIVRVLGERSVDSTPTTSGTPVLTLIKPDATAPASASSVTPIVPDAVRKLVIPASERAPDGKPHVLIADDDRQMRRLVRMILEREGYVVHEAADGLDALEMVEGQTFDLMILDLDMPRLDGIGVLEELRARVLTSSIPVIVLTARGEETEGVVLDLGAQDYLTKPVQPASLQARVRAVLRRAKIA